MARSGSHGRTLVSRLIYATLQRSNVVGQFGNRWPAVTLQDQIHSLDQDVVRLVVVFERDRAKPGANTSCTLQATRDLG